MAFRVVLLFTFLCAVSGCTIIETNNNAAEPSYPNACTAWHCPVDVLVSPEGKVTFDPTDLYINKTKFWQHVVIVWRLQDGYSFGPNEGVVIKAEGSGNPDFRKGWRADEQSANYPSPGPNTRYYRWEVYSPNQFCRNYGITFHKDATSETIAADPTIANGLGILEPRARPAGKCQ